MKKKVVFLASLLAASSLLLYLGVNGSNAGGFLSEDVESLADTETVCYVSSDSSENRGICRKAVDGTGDVCVDSRWYESRNCYGNSH